MKLSTSYGIITTALVIGSRRWLACVLLALATTSTQAQHTNGDNHSPGAVPQAFDSQGAAFIENKGQWDSRAKFLLQSKGLNVWITDRGARYDLYALRTIQSKTIETDQLLSNEESNTHSEPTMRSGHVIDISFEGASFTTAVRGTDRQPGAYNYFLGNDRSKWATDVGSYRGARIENLYAGIDAVFYLDEGAPRYDLVVAAHADPNQVRMKIEGSNRVSIGADGSLVIATTMGTLQQRELYAYQEVKGVRRQVACRFVVDGGGRVRFALGSYDRTRPLVIDPLVYSTYLNGATNVSETGRGIVVTLGGNAIVVGRTNGTGFPTTTGAYDATHNGLTDLFVTKMSRDGSALVYSTYIGGTSDEFATSIALDSNGGTYVTGWTTSNDYPITTGVVDGTYNGSDDVFVTKLNANGTALDYSTYLGGTGSDRGWSIAAGRDDKAYVTGLSNGNGHPTTTGAHDESHNGSGDVFVVKLNSAGTGLDYATFIGSTDFEEGLGIAIDLDSNAYITGRATGGGYPTTTGAYDVTHNGSNDVFVTKLNSTGSALIYSTFIGGTSSDVGNGIAVDSSGNAFVVGSTFSSNYPTTAGAFDEVITGSSGTIDAFVTKLSADGTALDYSTFLGGNGQDQGNAIAVDGAGFAYVTGNGTPSYPTTPDAVDRTVGGQFDVFITKLNEAGSGLVYSTVLGGGIANDLGLAIAIDGIGNIYVTGSASLGYPTTPGAYDVTFAFGADGFVTKLFEESLRDFSLPVELTDFTLSATNGNVTLSWRTASEIDNAGFEVQRAGDDTTRFTPIASYLQHPGLVGLGTSATGRRYSFIDSDLEPGLYRYRLVDVSTDGIRTEHDPKSILIDEEETQSIIYLRLRPVSPNPVGTELQIAYSLQEAMRVSLEVYTSDGRLAAVLLDRESREAGNHSQSVSVAKLAPGVYTLRLVAGSRSRVQRFVVVK